jgi:hypothetical protein
MFVWPHPPNWSQSFESSLRFDTDILRSRGGREQRIAKRFRPRIEMEFRSLAKREQFVKVQRQLFAELRNEIVMPFWPERTILSSNASGTTAQVSQVQDWMEAGAYFCIVEDGEAEAHKIASRSGSTITLDGTLSKTWGAGAQVYQGFAGWMDSKITQRAYTSEVNAVNVAFAATPGAEPEYTPGAAGTTFEGLEVWEFPNNWQAQPRIEIEDPREVVDYGWGSIEVFHPYDFPTVTRRVQLLRRGISAVREVEDFFRRHRGRQREFFIRNVQRDLLPTTGITSGGTTLQVSDPGIAAVLNSSTVHRALAVKLPSSGWVYRRIAGAFAGGAGSIITISGTWPETVSVNEIGRIAFLNVANFASDIFSTEWRTDSIATTTVTISTLEDFG